MIREVITYPNKLLREKSKDVVKFDEELHTLLDDMYETMIDQNGVGRITSYNVCYKKLLRMELSYHK